MISTSDALPLGNYSVGLTNVTAAPNNGTEGSLYHLLKRPPPLESPEPGQEYQDCNFPANDQEYEIRANLTNTGCQCSVVNISFLSNHCFSETHKSYTYRVYRFIYWRIITQRGSLHETGGGVISLKSEGPIELSQSFVLWGRKVIPFWGTLNSKCLQLTKAALPSPRNKTAESKEWDEAADNDWG